MKKLLLAIFTICVATSAFGELSLDSNKLYLKANAGAIMLDSAKDKSTKLKMKSKPSAFGGVGIGFYISDSVRTDLMLDFYTNLTMEKSGSFNGKSVSAKHKANISSLILNGYIDLFDVKAVKFFAGAGFGVACVKEKIARTFINRNKVADARTNSVKKKYNPAYQLTLGIAASVAPNVNLDLAYSWRDFGKTKSLTTKYGNTIGKTPYKAHHLIAGIRFAI